MAIGRAAERSAAHSEPARSANAAAKAPAMAASYQPKRVQSLSRRARAAKYPGTSARPGRQSEPFLVQRESGRVASEQFAQWTASDEHLKADGERDPQEQVGVAAQVQQVPGHHPDPHEGNCFHGAAATGPVRIQAAGFLRCGAQCARLGGHGKHLRSGYVRWTLEASNGWPVASLGRQLMPMTLLGTRIAHTGRTTRIGEPVHSRAVLADPSDPH